MKSGTELYIYIILSGIAIAGGIARYAMNYQNGLPFKTGIFIASVIASAFAGIMFGLVGISMNLPEPIIFAMTGVGGFFADQSLKLVMGFVSQRMGISSKIDGLPKD